MALHFIWSFCHPIYRALQYFGVSLVLISLNNKQTINLRCYGELLIEIKGWFLKIMFQTLLQLVFSHTNFLL